MWGVPGPDPRKRLKAEFFATEAGSEPVRTFLTDALSRQDRRRVGHDIRTVEYGWPVGMPVCRDLRNGLLEVRTRLDDRICRVLFAIYGDRMVLLHAFIKKTNKTPKRDLDTALQRKRQLETRR
jgi:phage-related protein